MEKLSFNDVKIGMMVEDHEGDIGEIIRIDDINNVVVEYSCGGIGYICMALDCCGNYLRLKR